MNRDELIICAELLKDTLISYMKYPQNNYLKDQFRYAYRNTFFLIERKYEASQAAYHDFYDKTGLDIRDYKWGQTVNHIRLNTHYAFEHKTPANIFKEELIQLANEGKLTTDAIVEMIDNQEYWWITKEENERLNAKGFKSKRPDSDEAYRLCGIIKKD
jgi:hypothetical protein